MDKVKYIDAASRLGMCANFAIADVNEGNPYVKEPVTAKQLQSRIQQCEDYLVKMREALR